jgi:hypothetical protein
MEIEVRSWFSADMEIRLKFRLFASDRVRAILNDVLADVSWSILEHRQFRLHGRRSERRERQARQSERASSSPSLPPPRWKYRMWGQLPLLPGAIAPPGPRTQELARSTRGTPVGSDAISAIDPLTEPLLYLGR